MDLQLLGDRFTDDDELVPREAGQGVPGPDQTRHPIGDGDEQLVPDQVPVAVVDQLEPIEVDEEYGHRIPGAQAAEQRVLQPLEEEEPVRETGEGIVQGAAVELLRRCPAARSGPGHWPGTPR